MRFTKITFFISILFVSIDLFPQSKLEKAEQYFENRHETIENGKANSKNIDQAINLFQQVNSEPEKTIGLLKCIEFKASWTDVSENKKRSLYKKAIDLAEKKSTEFPKNGAIAYWYAANYARWADLIDITEAANEGVLDEIKKLAEKAIKLDRNYNQAGALRLMGGMHLEVPNIPLILTWPSNKQAKKLLRQAYKIAPQHPANAYLYAKMLDITNKGKRSEKVFEKLVKKEARQEYFLVDQKYIQKGSEYFHENF